MHSLKKIFLLLLSAFCTVAATAQTNSSDETSVMRSNDKIYVVMAVVVIILAGLILYVARLDRKISKLEKEANSQ